MHHVELEQKDSKNQKLRKITVKQCLLIVKLLHT